MHIISDVLLFSITNELYKNSILHKKDSFTKMYKENDVPSRLRSGA